MIATDGVFSMDGIIANLPGICDLADKYDALVMVDDSHAVGFMGKHGRGTHEYRGVHGPHRHPHRHAGQGAGRRAAAATRAAGKEIIDLLRQRSRPYLFSNTLPPPIVGAAMKALEIAHRARPSCATGSKRTRSSSATGCRSSASRSCRACTRSCPIMLGDAALAAKMAEAMLRQGVYVIGFSYPVVPKGKARIRMQISAAHSREDLAIRHGRLRRDESRVGDLIYLSPLSPWRAPRSGRGRGWSECLDRQVF